MVKKSVYGLVASGLVCAVAFGNVAAVYPQAAGCRLFAETGHYVCDEFLTFYDARGGLEIFGYPLTEAFVDPNCGLLVQYFQRSRMEWRPYNPDPYKVQLGLLVDELGHNYPPVSSDQIPAFNSSTHHYFPETDHVVSYAFLDYFRAKGGLDIFGYPRSEFMYEDGYIVQYFQRARMEWHPEAAPDSQIRLTEIGEIYVDEFDIDISPIAGEPKELLLSASVQRAIIGRDEPQVVFVYVTDQHWDPIPGAIVLGVIHYPSGDQGCTFNPTDERGFARCEFDLLPTLPPGQKVVVDVNVAYGSLTATTQTFFIPWW